MPEDVPALGSLKIPVTDSHCTVHAHSIDSQLSIASELRWAEIPFCMAVAGLVLATACMQSVSCTAAGTRNIVGMQFHPTTGSLYFSCNGRDQIGDTDNGVTQNTPDDYIAYAPIAGLNFGYPYCHR